MTTDTNLVKATEHVHYELWMLCAMADALYFYEGDEPATFNAYLESFAIHYRALLQFFYGAANPRDDLFAEHYFPKGEWARLRPAKTEVLSGAEDAVNKEVVHLTYKRVTRDKASWAYRDIAHEMGKVMRAFVEDVDQNHLGVWARDLRTLADSVARLTPTQRDSIVTDAACTGTAIHLSTTEFLPDEPAARPTTRK